MNLISSARHQKKTKSFILLLISVLSFAISIYSVVVLANNSEAQCLECYAGARTSDVDEINLKACLRNNNCHSGQNQNDPMRGDVRNCANSNIITNANGCGGCCGTAFSNDPAHISECTQHCTKRFSNVSVGQENNKPPATSSRVNSTQGDTPEQLQNQADLAPTNAKEAVEQAEEAANRAETNCTTITNLADNLGNSTALDKQAKETCLRATNARKYATNAANADTDESAKRYAAEAVASADNSARDLDLAQKIVDEEREFAILNKKFKEEIKICKQAHDVAQECCSRPESCLKKPDGEQSEQDGAIGDTIKTVLGTAASIPAGSLSAMCGRMQTVGNIMTAFNGYLAMQCSRYVNQCKTKCKVTPELTAQINQKCEIGQNYNSDICTKIGTLKETFDDYKNECAIADNGSMQMAAQAIASQAAAKYAGTCKKLAEEIIPPAGEDLRPDDLFVGTNCANPTAQTMSFCQSQCSRPGAEQDPNCAAFLGKLNNSGGQFNNGGIDPKSLFGDLDSGDEGSQSPNFTDVDAKNAGSTGVGAGGGGGLLGGGGGAGGDSGDGGGAAGADGYNTKVDRGLASGNGYSSVGGRMMGGVSGGFSGYGNSKAITNSGKAFNLKDFLPSSKTQIKPFRSIASLSQEISPAHDDIFKKVTARFYQLCLRDALYDCSTLQKIKNGRD